MGAWGTKLYQADVTCDVRDEDIDWLKVESDNVKVTQTVIDNNIDYIEDEEDGPLFWFALADTQWKYGRLLPEVKEKAIKYIEDGKDLERWKDNDKQYQKRKKVLEELKTKLESEQPPKKKVAKLKCSRALWNIGDLLLYQIQDKELKDNKWYGKYVLFRVVSTVQHNIGSLPRDKYYHEDSVLGIYNWVGNKAIEVDKVKNLNIIMTKELLTKRPIEDLYAIGDKKINMDIVLEDKNYKSNYDKVVSVIGLSIIHSKNIDYGIIGSLKEAEENGTLIDETK